MMVKEIAFTAYSVRDLPRAREFYRDVVGLKEGQSFSEHWVEFDVGGGTFGLGDGTPLGIEPGSSFAITFEVDDLDATHARFRERGVDVGEVHEFPGCRVAFASDPEGNRFGIHQRKAG